MMINRDSVMYIVPANSSVGQEEGHELSHSEVGLMLNQRIYVANKIGLPAMSANNRIT